MKIATWNVNGIRARYMQLCEWIARDQPDVLCLQEIKALPDQVPSMVDGELDKYWCHWHGGKGYSGVGLHIRKGICPSEPVYTHPAFDIENRMVTAQLGNLTVASVYVPNGGKDFPAKMRFLESMEQWVAGFPSGSAVLICGDLNVARADIDVHPKERKPKAIGQLPEERTLLERILSQGLVDVGRALDPLNDQMFTWWAPWRNLRQRNIGWRLDYVLASQSLFDVIVSCKVLTEVGTSDHAPVMASFLDPPKQC